MLALALGCVLVFAADFVVVKRLAWTPGGFALSFGRMLQDGIVNQYLEDHCPDPKLTLCAYKDQLPDDADVWFWGSPLFDKLGRFAGLGQEMADIAVASVIDYPGQQLKTATVATAPAIRCGAYRRRRAQFDLAHLWDGPSFHAATCGAHGGRASAARRDIFHSDQPSGLSGCVTIDGTLAVIVLLAWRRRIPPAFGEFAAVCAVASRQRFCLRRNVKPARSLWRAAGLDRRLCRHGCACTPRRSSPIVLDRVLTSPKLPS